MDKQKDKEFLICVLKKTAEDFAVFLAPHFGVSDKEMLKMVVLELAESVLCCSQDQMPLKKISEEKVLQKSDPL